MFERNLDFSEKKLIELVKHFTQDLGLNFETLVNKFCYESDGPNLKQFRACDAPFHAGHWAELASDRPDCKVKPIEKLRAGMILWLPGHSLVTVKSSGPKVTRFAEPASTAMPTEWAQWGLLIPANMVPEARALLIGIGQGYRLAGRESYSTSSGEAIVKRACLQNLLDGKYN